MSKIDYNLQLIKAVVFDVDGVLSPVTVPLDNDGMPCRMVNVHDSFAMQLAVKKGIEIAVVTGGKCDKVRRHLHYLGITDVFTSASDKLPVLLEWMRLKGLRPDEVAYVGDDVSDLECMRHVTLSVAPADACVDIMQTARYISPAKGGYGVARDLLEEILRAKDLWLKNDTDLHW